MQIPLRKRVRIASEILDRLKAFRVASRWHVGQTCQALTDHVDRLGLVKRKLDICMARSWDAAASRLRRQIGLNLHTLPYHRQEIERAIRACTRTAPKLEDVYRELIQSEEEFGNLEYVDDEGLLSVCTEPINLKGIFLGEFKIQLHVPSLDKIGTGTVYTIVAQDPHPAMTNGSVTHPHVTDERLCAGDASAAMNVALAEGRICDFFVLIRSVLTNYNPGSTYVALEEWDGTPCFDCGYVTSESSRYWCLCCENEFCDECSSYCRVCNDVTCRGCLSECRICEVLTCPPCMAECPDCGELLCQDCMKDGRCSCAEEDEENDDEEETEKSAPAEAA